MLQTVITGKGQRIGDVECSALSACITPAPSKAQEAPEKAAAKQRVLDRTGAVGLLLKSQRLWFACTRPTQDEAN